MSAHHTTRQFGGGLVIGISLSLLLMGLLSHFSASAWTAAQEAAQYAWYNLGSSVLFFGLNIAYYIHRYQRLNQQLKQATPPRHELLHSNALLDFSIQMFLIIGIVYTAIGMRHALLYALGDSALQSQGSDILRRMVDGGILIALSSTIVGYIGGFVMRYHKKITLEQKLNYVLSQQQIQTQQQYQQWQQALLQALEQLPKKMPTCPLKSTPTKPDIL